MFPWMLNLEDFFMNKILEFSQNRYLTLPIFQKQNLTAGYFLRRLCYPEL